jgi:hypothetical protein
VRETNTRVARGVGVVVTKGPIASKCAAWDVFEKDGKDARRRAWPVLSVSSSAQSLGVRVDAPVLLADTVRDRSLVSRHVSLCCFLVCLPSCRATP